MYNVILFTWKKNAVVPFKPKWMQLKELMLSEISWMQKKKHCIFSLYMWEFKFLKKSIKTNKQKRNACIGNATNMFLSNGDLSVSQTKG